MRAPYLCSFLLLASFVVHTGAAWSASLVDDTREALRQGKYDRALKLIDAALDADPVDTNAHLLMTEYHLATQDYRAAELSTERTLVLNRGYASLVAQAYFNAGDRAMSRRQPGQALALYEAAVALDPAFKHRAKGKYMAVGNDLLAKRRYAVALSAFSQELALDPSGRKGIAEAVFAHGQSLLGSNDKAAERLFSYAVSLDSSYGQKAARAKSDHGLDLLRRAQEATGEERWKLKEQSLRYVSREIADQAIPAPVWSTVLREEYTGRGMNDEDGVIMAPLHGVEVKPGDRIIVTAREFQFFEDGWKTHAGTYETVEKPAASGTRVRIRAGQGEPIILEVQRPAGQ